MNSIKTPENQKNPNNKFKIAGVVGFIAIATAVGLDSAYNNPREIDGLRCTGEIKLPVTQSLEGTIISKANDLNVDPKKLEPILVEDNIKNIVPDTLKNDLAWNPTVYEYIAPKHCTIS